MSAWGAGKKRGDDKSDASICDFKGGGHNLDKV